MTGIDTNVLVRYLAQDDPAQAKLATGLIESFTAKTPGFISQVVLVETIWVLQSCYAASTQRVAEVVGMLLQVESLAIESAETVWRALRQYRPAGGDFADVLIAVLAGKAGCKAIYSFDRDAVKRFGMTLLK
ncbi:MAG: PIN domain-containing protein [Candidimonas sp.]|nr:MAG: PIN domain-containing protein [Candidimonas sp.]